MGNALNLEGRPDLELEEELVTLPASVLGDFYEAFEKAIGLTSALLYNIGKKVGMNAAKRALGTKNMLLDKALEAVIYLMLKSNIVKEVEVVELTDDMALLKVKGASIGTSVRMSKGPADTVIVGMMAGWLQQATGRRVEGKEVRCVAKGEPHCEFLLKFY
ncbi:MAG: hypothetical protein GXO07_02195 [Crenarchaeota archaeon]|nr:hypothetical protein [Thermoproteota archaeon]